MHIRKLSSSDIADILDLESAHAPQKPFYSKYDKNALNFIFQNPTTCGAFGMYDDQLIAWGCYRTQWKDENVKEGIFEISSIVVHTNYRRKGIGKKILYKIIDEIKTHQSFKEIYLTVYPKNKAALMLYIASDFVIYNYKKDVYGPGSDRVYLRLINREVLKKQHA